MSNFQIILTGLFIFFIILGVVLFSTVKSKQAGELAPIEIWGTLNRDIVEKFIADVNVSLSKPITITYTSIPESRFESVFVEALASGNGPDAIFIPHDMLLRQENKLISIPFSQYPRREYQDTFVQEAELYVTDAGILGLPLYVDPLVMYWNRDMLADAGVVKHPETWDEFGGLVKKLTKKDRALNVSQSAVALGEFENIDNAKAIVSALILQSGNPISSRDSSGKVRSVLAAHLDYSTPPAFSALEFYTQFANPASEFYSWNKAMIPSRTSFAHEDLAVYFGFASEISEIRSMNPNLNFDVATFPQSKSARTKTTFGTMYGLSITKASFDPRNTLQVLSILTDAYSSDLWLALTTTAPVRKDLLVTDPADPYTSIFYRSALISKGWLDPSKNATNVVFKDMVESVTSGRDSVDRAVQEASNKLDNLLQ